MVRLTLPILGFLTSACQLVIPHSVQPERDAAPADTPRGQERSPRPDTPSDGARVDAPPADAVRLEAWPKPDKPKADAPEPRLDAATPDVPKPKLDAAKPDAPKPKLDAAKPDAPKSDATPPCSNDGECGLYFRCCSGRCVNLANDPENCGYCGYPCPAGKR